MDQNTLSIEGILAAAVEIASAEERQSYMLRACAGDDDLRKKIERMVANYYRAGDFLEGSPALPVTVDHSCEVEMIGARIGAYKLLEQIGEGGMGIVYVAEQQQPIRRTVALKLVKPGMDSKQVIARFEAERQALALMDHPNIAKVLDAGTTDAGRPYFVMELVRGIPITDYCDQARLTVRQRLEVFVQVCRAVQHAHTKGVIHRDIKPSNVLVTSHDGVPVPLIIDFGVAKALGQQLTEHTLHTGFAQMLGTPLYMSPEQAEFNQLSVDTRSDIYSLGVLLYELLTGVTPFDKNRIKTVGYDEFRRILREEEPPRPSARLTTLGAALSTASEHRGVDHRKLTQMVRGELDWIVMKSLEKDRERRYETASAFAADLTRFLNDEPVQACPPSKTYRLRKFIRRNKAGLAVVVGVLIVFSVFSGGVGWMIKDREKRAHSTAEEIDAALKESADWQERRRLPEALSAARRARGALAGGHADTSLLRKVEARENDLQLLLRLEGIRLDYSWEGTSSPDSDNTGSVSNQYDYHLVDTLYRNAFREAGLNMEDLPAQEFAAQLLGTTVPVELAANLDSWSFLSPDDLTSPNPRWKHLLQVARIADPDPWRVRVREALERKNRAELMEIAASEEVSRLLPPTLLVLAHALRSQGAPRPGLALLREMQNLHPDDFWANEDLGYWLRTSKTPDHEAAIRFYTAALAIRPSSAPAHGNLGNALRDKGQFDEAIAEYRKAICIEPKKAEYYSGLGNVHFNRGDMDGAIAEYRRAVDLKNEDASSRCNLGIALRRKGELSAAIVELRKAIDLKVDGAKSHNELGLALLEKADLEGAIAEFCEAIRLQANSARAHTNLGNALRSKGDLDGSIAAHANAIFFNNEYADAYHNLGNALIDKGDLDGAIAAFRKAISLNHPKSHTDLGSLLAMTGDKEGALAEFHETLRLYPELAVAHCNLGLYLRDEGRFTEALKYLRRGHELGTKKPRWSYPTDQLMKECERLIELEPKLPAILSGKEQPAHPTQRVEFASLCQKKHLYASAVHLFQEAITAKPELVASPINGSRYDFACCAALAGCGMGKDAANRSDAERASLRKQALDWLRADFNILLNRQKKAPTPVAEQLQHWLRDLDFNGVRNPNSLSKLPQV
jgi:serine/threonine protein kinase/tetratricopeptide (TPR) repeat protein